MRSIRFIRPAILLAGTSALASAFTAHAQTAPREDVLEEIVVTGSRVITNGNDSPSPVTMIQADALLKSTPGNLQEALGSIPAFAGSRSTTSAPAVQGSQGGGNASANMLNLRNLGVMRTLVLLDGYRIPPTTFNNAVDADIIPQMLVQRVDLVTGGVSAVYGSDAVAGVVNYILDKKFNGIRVEGSVGQSERHDAKKWDIGIAAGTELFGGRGHIEGSIQHLDNSGILSKSERPWIWGWGVTGNGTAANPYTSRNNVRVAGASYGGVINTVGTPANPLNNQQFATNGVLSTFTPGSPLANVGGDAALYDTSLMAPTKQDQFFVRYDHDLTDNLHGYLQVAGEVKNDEVYGDNYRETVSLSPTNPFLNPAYSSQMTNAGITIFRLNQLMGNFSRYHSIIDSKQWVYTAGLEGSLGDFKWGLNYSRGRSQLDNEMENSLNYQRLYAAVDAIAGPNGPVCYASTVSSAYSNCVPINLFGPTAASAAALAYIMPQAFWTAVTTQDNVTGHISGSLFDTWAGPVNMALSAEWRKLAFRESSTSDATAFVDCSVIRGSAVGRANCALAAIPGNTTRGSQGLWKYPFPSTDTLSQSVKEAALEADVPLVKDVPGIQSLNVNGALRYTKYSLSGDYTTWKLGLDWHINDAVRFRATGSEDIRAPSLYELYVPASSLPVSPIDLLTGPTATAGPTVPSRDQGNINLSAEVGKTLTGGIVINATPNLSFALDGYQIKIEDAIQLITGSNAANQQTCYASAAAGGPLSPLCSLQDRPLGTGVNAFNPNNPAATAASNAWTAVYARYANIASIKTYGADLEINYKMRIAERAVNLRLLTAYQPHSLYESPGQRIDQGGAAFGPTGYYPAARLRITGLVHAELTDAFSIDLMQRYRNAMKIDGDESLPPEQRVWANNRIASFTTTNLTLTYKLQLMEQADTEFYLNVSNLFDAKAPGGSFIGNSVRPGLRDSHVTSDDVVGRAYTLGFKLKM